MNAIVTGNWTRPGSFPATSGGGIPMRLCCAAIFFVDGIEEWPELCHIREMLHCSKSDFDSNRWDGGNDERQILRYG
jgi:hypothetical protein